MFSKRGFTIIELLLSITLISFLVIALLIALNPASSFAKARDVQRFNDLQSISVVLSTLLKEKANLSFGGENVIYLSLSRINSATCSEYRLPIITSSYQYQCSPNPEKVDGTGWIPVDFTLNPIVGLKKLPIDPMNKPPFFYSYRAKNKLTKLSAHFEYEGNLESSYLDGGSDPILYEVGSDLSLMVPENGLTLSYHLEEGTGTITKDDSGFYFDASLINFGFTTTSGWTNGKIGRGLIFDGLDDYLKTNYALQTNNLSEFTFCSWFLSTFQKLQTLFSFSTTSYFGIHLDNGQLKFYTKGNDGSFDVLSTDGQYADGKWHFVCGWYQATSSPNKKIFVDGKVKNKVLAHNQNALGDNSQKFAIIGRELYGDHYYAGKIDEIYFYQKAISESEIKRLYYLTK